MAIQHNFKIGEKVTLKKGCKTKDGLMYLSDFDRLIGKEMTVKGFSINGSVIFKENLYYFHQDWLEKLEKK